ncbi:unnamed protein product [Didymodactylos carnosus]|uniref:NADP-dependent oxidoreductase domain-containing protein n=1 Tax=Didymodactylos carnosus TaxID=1234261 RepID=A0A816CGN6_9BILA|nr:unnamed protein product [Didymodactylos carnosus]CAF4511360.1 unnamed protein product [Didymodactylos carnosus]
MTFRLPNGLCIPSIAFGTGTSWFRGNNDDPVNRKLINCIKNAIELGYRHIDTAEMYGTEREVGIAIKESICNRDEIYITTKIYCGLENPEQALNNSLNYLQTDYIDLYLIHSPYFDKTNDDHAIPHIPENINLEHVWKQMETFVENGRVKSIGLANFQIKHIKQILSVARIKPVVNQIEYHPQLQQRELIQYLNANKILIEAYTPLACLVHNPGTSLDRIIEQLAQKYQKKQVQVLLKWSLQKQHVVVTTSSDYTRQKESIDISDFRLSNDDMDKIDEEGSKYYFRKHWKKQIEND